MELIMRGDLALLLLSFSPKLQTGLPLWVPDWLELPCAFISIPGDVRTLARDSTHSVSKFLKKRVAESS